MRKFEATVALRVVMEFDQKVKKDNRGLDHPSDRSAAAKQATKLAKELKVPGAKVTEVIVEEVRSK